MLSGSAPGDGSAYAAIPAITNYGISPVQSFYPSVSSSSVSGAQHMGRVLRGDTSVRPNIGQTNDEIGGFGSLREVTARLRWITIACTLASLIWEGFAFPSRLLVHTWDHPAKVVLGGYLAFFSLLLLGVELNAPMQDLFGVLYHPLGRGIVLALLSSMSYAISIAWWEIILCAAFAGCSGGYLYAYIKYPEYRRWQDYNDNRIWSDMRQAVQASRVGTGYGNSSSVYWADPVSERSPGSGHFISANQSWANTQRETQSLLHQI
jgi:COPI associated protein